MVRRPDPKTDGPINIRPRNDDEKKLFREFRRVCAKDGIVYLDLFKPIMEAKVVQDNPQLHFVSDAAKGELHLSRQPKQEVPGQRQCEHCHGSGCEHCARKGWVIDNPGENGF